jgi:hypothetical protein
MLATLCRCQSATPYLCLLNLWTARHGLLLAHIANCEIVVISLIQVFGIVRYCTNRRSYLKIALRNIMASILCTFQPELVDLFTQLTNRKAVGLIR